MPSSSEPPGRPWRRRAATAIGVGRLMPWYVAFGVLRHVVPLPWLARWAWQTPMAERNQEQERKIVARVARIRRVIERRHGDCLQSSLVLYRELSRLGADPTLVVGFRRANGRIVGHAWVLAGGRPVPESASVIAEYTPTFGFGPRGSLHPTPEWASARVSEGPRTL